MIAIEDAVLLSFGPYQSPEEAEHAPLGLRWYAKNLQAGGEEGQCHGGACPSGNTVLIALFGHI